MWKNIVTSAKSKVAETLDEFRSQHLYNYMDRNVQAFNARVPMIAQWDDHEVTNNWYPNEVLASDDRYVVKSTQLLSSRAAHAFHEMMPTRQSLSEPMRIYRKVSYGPLLDIFVIDMRTYRGDNTVNTEAEGTPFLGADQLAWLKREMINSTATWKVIASDMPIGMMVRDGETNMENGANGDGPVLGREKDIAAVLSFIKSAQIANTVWLTADVHYTAAHHYPPIVLFFRTSNRSGSSYRAHCMRAPLAPPTTTIPSGPRCVSPNIQTRDRRICHPATGCSSSARLISPPIPA